MSEEFEDYRMGYLVRTAEVWKQLTELGATEESKLDFDFQFSTKDGGAVKALQTELADYPLEVSSEGLFKKSFTISGNSGPITWSEEQLLKWVDYLIQVGHDAGCEFEGCGASAP
ncbi:hypothetical protein FT643_23020 [Ketobacter sp. MCCC 1A13808]|uniref:hypothetical protein n=1 Tax=Ketobacter sp. MCCC 1A13808 TaxID=2602738 RepID=UPI0012EB316F|nr:hypothetical protein [Ketobacter sp. MCCC 1A13808]MVF14999.1 hypothetical protein [Ketobacter sp. MCCC 1A13808]